MCLRPVYAESGQLCSSCSAIACHRLGEMPSRCSRASGWSSSRPMMVGRSPTGIVCTAVFRFIVEG